MPARSTKFQNLIANLERLLAKPGVVVRESRMLRDSACDAEREVDVVIEHDDGNRKQFVCVECVEGRRPATLEWVEQMWGKHFHLPTNQLVLVSESGFTPNAIKKAHALERVEIMSLTEAQNFEWPKLITGGIQADHFLVPVVSRVNVVFPATAKDDVPENITDVLAQCVVVDPDGADHGSALDLATRYVNAPEAVAQVHKMAFEGVNVLECRIPLRQGCRLRIPSGHLLPIVMIDFEARCERKTERVEMKPATYGSTQVAHGASVGFDGPVQFVAAPVNDAISLLVACPKTKATNKSAKKPQ